MSVLRSGDEDWSIISSSSDMDEERSTTSGYEEEHDPSRGEATTTSEKESPDDQIEPESSITTLKLPHLRSSSFSEEDADAGAQGRGSRIGDSSLRQIEEIPLQDLSKDKAPEMSPITRIINFYEGLSHKTLNLHNSIKQNSDLLYKHFARSQGKEGTVESKEPPQEDEDISSIETRSSDAGEELTEGVVDTKDVSSTPTPDTRGCKFASAGCKFSTISNDLKIKSLGVYESVTADLDNLLRSYSEYLIYFLIISVVGAFSTFKLIQYFTYTPVPDPSLWDTTFEKVYSMLYEDVNQKSWFGSKTIKQLRFSNEATALYQRLTDRDFFTLFKNSAREYFDICVKQSRSIVSTVHRRFLDAKNSHQIKTFLKKSTQLSHKFGQKTVQMTHTGSHYAGDLSAALMKQSRVFSALAVEQSKVLFSTATMQGLKALRASEQTIQSWNIPDKAHFYAKSAYKSSKEIISQVSVDPVRYWLKEGFNWASQTIKSYSRWNFEGCFP